LDLGLGGAFGESGEGNEVAGVDDFSLVGFELEVVIPGAFAAGEVAVVVDDADGDECREAGSAAEVVEVIVGADEVVDFFEAGDFGGDVEDAIGVALAGVAGVDEDGFIGGGDDEG
jgi:hypothetical protein